MPQLPAVSTVTCRRLRRVGACPVLEVSVAYPRLDGDLSPAVTRFNETYRAMAEAFLIWAETAPAEEAENAFLSLGSVAPYRFDRRILTCDMRLSAEEGEGPAKEESCTRLTVKRTVRLTSRRGEAGDRSLSAVDEWRWPELTFLPRSRRRKGRPVSAVSAP